MSQGAIIMATKGSMYLSNWDETSSVWSFFSDPSCLEWMFFVGKKNSRAQLAVLVAKTSIFLGKQIIKLVHVPLIYHVCRTISMGIRHVYAIAYIRNQLTSSWTGVKIFQHIFWGDFRSIVWMLPRPTNSD